LFSARHEEHNTTRRGVMKNSEICCIDCGSRAVNRVVDEVRPVFRMEVTDFACGAVFKSIFSRNGNIGRVSHSGCRQHEESVLPI
jgi:hypothetical protein